MRYPLRADEVVHALRDEGFDVSENDVHLPMQLSATVSNPALQLMGADRLPDGHLRMRMRCRTAGECLPFNVTVKFTHVLQSQPATKQEAAATLPSSPPNAAAATPQAAARGAATQTLSLAPGTSITLLLEDGHMHIHVPVLTLDRAVGGELTRVETLDHKHVYQATLVDANTARGMIQ